MCPLPKKASNCGSASIMGCLRLRQHSSRALTRHWRKRSQRSTQRSASRVPCWLAKGRCCRAKRLDSSPSSSHHGGAMVEMFKLSLQMGVGARNCHSDCTGALPCRQCRRRFADAGQHASAAVVRDNPEGAPEHRGRAAKCRTHERVLQHESVRTASIQLRRRRSAIYGCNREDPDLFLVPCVGRVGSPHKESGLHIDRIGKSNCNQIIATTDAEIQGGFH